MKKFLTVILCLVLVIGCFPLTAMADDTTIEGDGDTSISLTTIVPELSFITVTPPTKTQYKVGDTLDTTGMVVTASYTDESTKEVTSLVSLSGFDSSTAGEVTVTVSYTEGEKTVTATFTVTIVTTYSVSLSASPAEGGIVTGAGSYSDGETVTVAASANGGYRFDHWTSGTGSIINDASFTFVIHENHTYEAVFVEDASHESSYTLVMPDSITISPNAVTTVFTVNVPALDLQPNASGNTPESFRVKINAATLVNQSDAEKTISFKLCPYDETVGTSDTLYFRFDRAQSKNGYIVITDSQWNTATPGVYTGSMTYQPYYQYSNGDPEWLETIRSIPITLIIPEPATSYTVTVEPGEGIGTAFAVQSTTVISRNDFISGNYDQSQGCFYLDDDEKVYYALPTQCSFTAPNDKEFDCWECSFGGTFTGGTSFDIASTGDFTITALWKNQPQNSVTLSIPATINVNYGDTQTPFDVQVKSAAFNQGNSAIEIKLYNSSFSCEAHDGTIPFTVSTNSDRQDDEAVGCRLRVFDGELPYSFQGYINISSESWAAAKPGSYTATLRLSASFN